MLKAPKRIAAVHDISGVGKCSMTVALPVISASGVECACMPTALLSTHTAVFQGYTFRDLTDEMLPIAAHWKKEKIHFDGVYSGYLANPEQVELLKTVIDDIANDDTLIICDPAMADHGKFYYGFDQSMADAFRDFAARADILTPNITEAAFMTGLPYKEGVFDKSYIEDMLKALAALGSKTIVLTGVRFKEGEVGAAIYAEGKAPSYIMKRERIGAFHGTGDVFASAFAALAVRGASLEAACDTAIELVIGSIDRTLEQQTPMHMGVDFEGFMAEYISMINKLEYSK